MRIRLFVLVSVLSSVVMAQPAKPGPKPAAAKADLGPALQKLKSGDEGRIKAALDDLRIAGPAGAPGAAVVAEVLAKGLNEPLTIAAIETLGELESPDGSSVLADYASHRSLTVRRAAVKALTRTKGPAASNAMKRSLGDSDAQIRGLAASGLGTMKANDAVADLFVALDHKVVEAAASIGQLCTPEQCERLAAKIGVLPFDVVTSGLDPVLFRPTAEVPDDSKIKVIGRLRELGTAEANRFLGDVEKRLPKEASARIKQAVEQAVKATAGGSQ